MPIGADISAQYTEEAVGGGHPTKARVIDRLALAGHHVDGKHNADLIGIQANCRLVRTNATALTLRRFNGRSVPFIDGAGNLYYLQLASEPALANTGLAAGTLYYVYAWDNAGAIALEASTGGYAQHASGLYTKSGSPSRTLVGMARTEGSTPGQFVDSLTQRFTRSWFNEPPVLLWRSGTDGATTTSGTPAEHNGSRRLEFIAWAGEAAQIGWGGAYNNDDPSSDMEASIGVDGTASESGSERVAGQHATGAENIPFYTAAVKSGLSEGYHYATLLHRRITAAGTVSTTSAGGSVLIVGPRG